jgi:hypothetical protein
MEDSASNDGNIMDGTHIHIKMDGTHIHMNMFTIWKED